MTRAAISLFFNARSNVIPDDEKAELARLLDLYLSGWREDYVAQAVQEATPQPLTTTPPAAPAPAPVTTALIIRREPPALTANNQRRAPKRQGPEIEAGGRTPKFPNTGGTPLPLHRQPPQLRRVVAEARATPPPQTGLMVTPANRPRLLTLGQLIMYQAIRRNQQRPTANPVQQLRMPVQVQPRQLPPLEQFRSAFRAARQTARAANNNQEGTKEFITSWYTDFCNNLLRQGHRVTNPWELFQSLFSSEQ